MNEPALVIDKLEKTYADGTKALGGVSITVPTGDFYALLGPNGAGKTTLIGIVTGLVNKTGGSVKVFGVDIAKEPEKARTLDFFAKSIDILVNQAGYYGIPRSVAIPRAEEVLKGLGLTEKRDSQSRTLSGGMQRRLMIARALMNEPKLLILDEPTAGVDVEMRRSMWEYLETLTKKGVTIILTTHYLEEAEQLAKNVAIINKGVIVASGTMDEVLALNKGGETKGGFRGGRLEEVFLQLIEK
jgi:ABC-2 type transport system ATP-binding protein